MELKKHKSAQCIRTKTLKPQSHGDHVRIQPTQPGQKTWNKGAVTNPMSANIGFVTMFANFAVNSFISLCHVKLLLTRGDVM